MNIAPNFWATRPSKYRAQPTVVDGIRFDSKREAKRWGELCLLVKVGAIANLRRQWKFPLIAGDGVTQVGLFIADFVYEHKGQEVIEDSKGVRTPLYRLKKKLFEAQYGKPINEV